LGLVARPLHLFDPALGDAHHCALPFDCPAGRWPRALTAAQLSSMFFVVVSKRPNDMKNEKALNLRHVILP
jgi:hypothetical protein